jgi:hypothetical protein
MMSARVQTLCRNIDRVTVCISPYISMFPFSSTLPCTSPSLGVTVEVSLHLSLGWSISPSLVSPTLNLLASRTVGQGIAATDRALHLRRPAVRGQHCRGALCACGGYGGGVGLLGVFPPAHVDYIPQAACRRRANVSAGILNE